MKRLQIGLLLLLAFTAGCTVSHTKNTVTIHFFHR